EIGRGGHRGQAVNRLGGGGHHVGNGAGGISHALRQIVAGRAVLIGDPRLEGSAIRQGYYPALEGGLPPPERMDSPLKHTICRFPPEGATRGLGAALLGY